MDRGRLSYGEMVAGVSAILLSYLSFFDWFGSTDSGELHLISVGRDAWEALDYIPIILVAAIVAALAVPTLRLMKASFKPRIPLNAVVALLGIASVALICFRIIDQPNFGSFRELWGISGSKEPPKLQSSWPW